MIKICVFVIVSAHRDICTTERADLSHCITLIRSFFIFFFFWFFDCCRKGSCYQSIFNFCFCFLAKETKVMFMLVNF